MGVGKREGTGAKVAPALGWVLYTRRKEWRIDSDAGGRECGDTVGSISVSVYLNQDHLYVRVTYQLYLNPKP